MGKSTRIILLSVTVVLAVAAFLVLWAVRPGSDSMLLEQARSRQVQGLVDIDAEVDYDQVAAALVADDGFMNSLSSVLLDDEESAARLDADEVEKIVEAAIDSYVAENMGELETVIDNAIRAYVDDNMDELDVIIDDSIRSYVDANYDTLLSLIAQQVALESVDEDVLAQALVEPVSQAVMQDLQAYIGSIDVDAIVAGVEDQVEAYVLSVFEQATGYTDEQIAALKDALMDSDEVRSLMDDLESRIMDEVDSRIEDSASRRVVSIPDFESSPVVTSEDDYSSVREAERQGAIQNLLNALVH